MSLAAAQSGPHLSKVALQVATEAARSVLKGFRTNPEVTLKPGDEPVTAFDLESETLIRRRLAELTPTIPVVGEEQGGEAEGELTWYCDPIDGTVNFTRGHPYFGVSLGVAKGGEPFAGAVVAPALRTWWRGSRDDRAYRNDQPCSTSALENLETALVTTGLPLRHQAAEQSGLEPLEKLGRTVRDLRRCGSAALELCMVADGTYDAYFTGELAPWDTCAGAAILMAAGGVWRKLNAGNVDYELGCSSGLEDRVITLLGSKDTLPAS